MGGWQWVVAVSVVGSLANPSRRKMNGSGPGVVRQLTGVVIATRQPRSDPAHPCNIHTRPLLPSFSTDSFFFSPIHRSPFQDKLSQFFVTHLTILLSIRPEGISKRNRADIISLSYILPQSHIWNVYSLIVFRAKCVQFLNFRNNIRLIITLR